MERKDEWKVGGFQFGSPKDAQLAKEELEKISYLESRMRYDSPKSVLAVYNRLIDTKVFRTPVGYQYLQKLRDYLNGNELGNEAVDIPLYQVYSYDPNENLKVRTAKRRAVPSTYSKLRTDLRRSVILNIVLIVLVIAMFVITMTGDNPNIINYKISLTNKYAGWEQDLDRREREVRQRERELGIENGVAIGDAGQDS